MVDLTFSLPLIAAQPGIWMADQLSAAPNAYAVAHCVTLRGEIDPCQLSQAILLGLKEADTLHYGFADMEGEARQYPDLRPPLSPEILDLRAESQPEMTARRLMTEDLSQDLRITSDIQPYRHLLMRVADHRWSWYQRYHHLMVDGFSFVAITRRIAEIYRLLRQNKSLSAPPFTAFDQVVAEYQAYQDSKTCQRDREYWQEKCAALPQPLSLSELPLSGQPASTNVIRRHLTLAPESLHFLHQQLDQAGLTALDGAVALVASWIALLTGQQPLSAGFIFMRRIGSAALSATGPVINILPMAIDFQPELSLPALAKKLASEIRKNRRHQRYDAEQITRDIGRLGNSAPLFGPVINVKLFDYQLNFDDVTAETEHLASGPVRDIEIALMPRENGSLELEFLANADRYTAAQLDQHIQRLPLLAAQLNQTEPVPLGSLNLLTGDEAAQLAEVNQTAIELPEETLWSLIQAQCQQTPDAAALADNQYCLSYQQMQQQVFALADILYQRGVRSGDIVAVALPRSIFLSLALQTIVRLGAIWLPLDTGYPDDRLQLMLDDASPRLLITCHQLTPRFARISPVVQYHYQKLLAEQQSLPYPLPHTRQGAYLIYTSGSTGHPKGVLVSHRAIVNRLMWMQNHYPLSPADVVLQKTPGSFDVSVWEFFWPLISGASLFIAPPDAHRDPEWLLQIMVDQQVTVTHFVPSMLGAFLENLTTDTALRLTESLRLVFCSGETLPALLARQWEKMTSIALHNLYGPTEAAVDVSWYPAYGDKLRAVTGNSVPVGWPVWNTQLHILDHRLQPVPPGVAGELWISGIQLAEGYLGRPDLTASHFIAAPWGDDERIYRSGDIARRLPNGAIEYLGRNDDQLKIRGQRIELTEIDTILLSLKGIRRAATVAVALNDRPQRFEDNRQLVSYIITSDITLDPKALRTALAARLPAYMVPVMIVQVENFPLSSNGKLDRRALPAPVLPATNADRPPETATEHALAALFCELLSLSQVNAEDDFFKLGGHSLLAMRLAARVRRDLNYPLHVGQVMVSSSVAELAALIDATDEVAQDAGFGLLLPLRCQHGGPTLFCFHPASGFAWQFSILQRYLDQGWNLIGIQSPDEQGPLGLSQSIDDVCDIHLQTVLSQQPSGPYYFIGYSLGGILAQGIAARLEARGETVNFLGLLDTWPPETQNWEGPGENARAPDVIAEVNREREQFFASQRQLAGSEMSGLFDQVEANYGHSVRLLATAHSAVTQGTATLFSALKTQQPSIDAAEAWAPFIRHLNIVPVDCAHPEIISDPVFEIIGPEINHRLQPFLKS